MQVLRVFHCTEVYGKDYLSADLRIVCYNKAHVIHMVFAGIGVLMYPLGIPACFLYLLFDSRIGGMSEYKEAKIIFGRYAHPPVHNEGYGASAGYDDFTTEMWHAIRKTVFHMCACNRI